MSFPADPLAFYESRRYQTLPPPIQRRPGQAHWLTSASPITKATTYHQPQITEKVSTSSESSRSTMDTTIDSQSLPHSYSFEDFVGEGQHVDASLAYLHLSALENGSSWTSSAVHQVSAPAFDESFIPSSLPHGFSDGYPNTIHPHSPYSCASVYDESPLQSSYYSSPEIAYSMFSAQPPRSLPAEDYEYEEEDDGMGGKPYARLIYEALMQAPGHRMMLRDIYEWFEKNTSKPRESGTNGWQNSIRHNLSMNHAFENDKTQSMNARGEPKKATSVWFLTDKALRNGVQSTTRYRKTGGARKSALNGRPDAQRARSGAKGGRAARRAARLRQIEQSPHLPWSAPVTPSELGSFDQLVQAANAMNEFPRPRSNSPPSPVEQEPYTPCSIGSRGEFAPTSSHGMKYESGANFFDEYSSQDLLFPQNFDNHFNDSWLQTSQQ